MRSKIVFISLISLLISFQSALGASINLGYQSLQMKLHPNTQVYESEAGEQQFRPEYNGGGAGKGSFLSVSFELFGFEYGTQSLEFDTLVPAAVTGTTDLSASGKFDIQYYGAGIFLRREIGSAFLTAGNARTEESISAGGITYKHSDSRYYYHYGVDMSLGVIGIRAGIMKFPAGEHKIDLTHIGLIIQF